RRAGRELEGAPVPGDSRRRALRDGLREGEPARRLRERCARQAEGKRSAGGNPAAVASEGDRRAGPEVSNRSSRIVGLGAGGPRGVAIALPSTVVFFVLLVVAVTHAPGWPAVPPTLFTSDHFPPSLPPTPPASL